MRILKKLKKWGVMHDVPTPGRHAKRKFLEEQFKTLSLKK